MELVKKSTRARSLSLSLSLSLYIYIHTCMDEVEKWEIVYVIWYKLIQVAILKFDFQFALTNPVSGFPLTGPTWIIKVVWGMLYAKVFQVEK